MEANVHLTGNDEQRLAAVEGLVRCADAHRRGEFTVIEREFDRFEQALPQDTTRIPDDVLLAFNFWDAWADSSNHDWRFHEPIRQSDWPELARQIAIYLLDRTAALDPMIEQKFGVAPVRTPWYLRAWHWFRGGAG